MRVIAIEEHYWTTEIRDAVAPPFVPPAMAIPLGKLADIGDERIADMDAAGIDLQVLSVSAPAVQNLEPAVAIPLARQANDRLAAAVTAHPDRFAGFATLATSDPQASADELDRTVSELGFKGALINGHTKGQFLDQEQYRPILAKAEALDVPLYLHPTFPTPAVMEAYYSGLPPAAGGALSGAGWGWHAETALHSIRMVVSGVFDRYPGLQIVIGHMGENLPFSLARVQERMGPVCSDLERDVVDYFHQNFWYTTSGYFTVPPLLCALLVVGADRLIFSVDYPFSDNVAGREFLDAAPISPADREKIAHGNVEKLLRLPTGTE